MGRDGRFALESWTVDGMGGVVGPGWPRPADHRGLVRGRLVGWLTVEGMDGGCVGVEEDGSLKDSSRRGRTGIGGWMTPEGEGKKEEGRGGRGG